MSMTLMQHVKVLAVGVALMAIILAMAPGVATAETKLDGKADAALKGGDGGGGVANKGDGIGANLGGKVDGALEGNGDSNKGDGGGADNLVGKADGALKGDARSNLGDTNLDSDTKTGQRVDLNDPPLVGGDTKSVNEVNSDLVPAKGEAKADGDLVVDDLIDEGLCVRGAVNQNASGCGGAGGDAGNGDDTATVPDLDVDPSGALGNTTVESVTDTDQRVDLNDPPLVDGGTTTVNEANSVLVPVRGNADVDALVEVDGLLREEVCGRNALNRDAGGCGGSVAGPGDGDGSDDDDNNGIIDLDELPGDTTADSVTDIDENLDPSEPPLGGTVDNVNDVDAEIVPASAVVDLDGNATVGDLLDQDLSSCTTLNASGCGEGAAPVPDPGEGNVDLDELPGDTTADSVTDIDENLDPSEPPLGGTVDNVNDVDAEIVPASAVVDLDGNGNDDDSTPSEGGDNNGNDDSSPSGDSGDSDDTGSGSDDTGDELAFAAPADGNGGSTDTGRSGSGEDSGSENSGSANEADSRIRTLSADPSSSRTQTLAARPSSGSNVVALAGGPSKDEGKTSDSSGSESKSAGKLPDTGGISLLVPFGALLLIAGGILLLTTRRWLSS